MKMDFLEIKQFRGLKDLSLKRLGDVNLLLGNNDIGKTTVLEAVQMFEAPESIDTIIRNARTRVPDSRLISRDNYTAWDSLMSLFPFKQGDRKEISLFAGINGLSEELIISGRLTRILRPVSEAEVPGYTYSSAKRKNLLMTEQDVLTFQGSLCVYGSATPLEIDEFYRSRMPLRRSDSSQRMEYMSPGDHLSGRGNSAIYRSTKQQESEIVELLRLIDPEIEGFKLQPGSTNNSMNQVIEHRRFGNIPLYTYGDGMKKAISLANKILSAKGGILLIDEIETSLQASNLQHVFSWLLDACRQFRVQLFATTHSLEAVSALVDCAVKDARSELACYRLEADGERVFAKRFSESDLDSMVNGRGIDVR